MRARYLVRFDDICPTMNWSVWTAVERILAETSVAPILSVVPDNQDDHLRVQAADPRFWDRVRAWQGRGWTIALHGYQHRYVTRDPGIVGLNERSEFAGLPHEEQESKLRSALGILRREGVTPRAWVAPSHSFDAATVEILERMGIRIVSDGLFLFPRVDAAGVLWIPQQLWRFYRAPLGVLTVCLHINSWTSGRIETFREDIRRYADRIATLDEIAEAYRGGRPRNVSPWIARLLLTAKRAKTRLQGARRRGTSGA